MDKLGPTSTFNDLVKLTGSQLKLIKEDAGKKTYEFKVANEVNLYADFTYFKEGQLSEKTVFRK